MEQELDNGSRTMYYSERLASRDVRSVIGTSAIGLCALGPIDPFRVRGTHRKAEFKSPFSENYKGESSIFL